MKINVGMASYEGRWFDFGREGVRLKVRPLPASRFSMLFKDGGMVLSGEESLEMFSYCWTGQEGIVDADDKPLKLTADVKKIVYDFKTNPAICPVVDGISLVDFVMQKARKLTDSEGDDLKN